MAALAAGGAPREQMEAAVTSVLSVDIKSKCYAPDAAPLLCGAKFSVGGGEFVALTGRSGCGKTTLLNIAAGLDTNYDGEVRADSAPSFVFQEPRLLPWRTLRENVLLAGDAKDARFADFADSLIVRAGLDGWQNAYPSQLSLGMARRAAVARALSVRPALILMDEPFASLDEQTAEELRAMLLALLAEAGAAALFVTHNLREAAAIADRLIVVSSAAPALRTDIALPPPRGKRAAAEIDRLLRETAPLPEIGGG